LQPTIKYNDSLYNLFYKRKRLEEIGDRADRSRAKGKRRVGEVKTNEEKKNILKKSISDYNMDVR
jgi:hypothetical protein